MSQKVINKKQEDKKTNTNTNTNTIRIFGITEGVDELTDIVNRSLNGYIQDNELIVNAYHKGLDKDIKENLIDELSNYPDLIPVVLLDLIKGKANSFGITDKELKKRQVFIKKVINLVKDDIFKAYSKKIDAITKVTNQLSLDDFENIEIQ